MKKLIVLIILVMFVGCSPSMYVNPYSHHNYYNRYRTETYTSPTWIPGHGVILQTHIIPKYRYYQPRYVQPRAPRRGRH